jgi:hypothetical protein
MNKPELLITGKFRPEDIIVSVSESTRKIEPSIESKLDLIWEEKIKHASETGKKCYNGLSYRLNSFEESNGKLKIDFGIIDFKTRDGLIAIPEYFDLPQEYYRKGCFACSSVRTADDKYLMVELTGKSMNPNNTEQIGGIMETDIEMKSGESVFECLYKEYQEEIGVEENEIQDCYLQSIYLAAGTNIAFYFESVLSVNSPELLERFKNNTDTDIKSICVYTREEYLEALKNHKSLNKQFTVQLLCI